MSRRKLCEIYCATATSHQYRAKNLSSPRKDIKGQRQLVKDFVLTALGVLYKGDVFKIIQL